jgi:chaperonin GroEL
MPKKISSTRQPLIFSPDALEQISRGFNRMADLFALTLGPTQGVIVNARNGRSEPEFLTDSGTIAKRVVELSEQGENTGAMILRSMIQELYQNYGDGASTASVLAAAIIQKAIQLIAAGANPMRMRSGLERGLSAALTALASQAHPLAGQELLTHFAIGVTGNDELGRLLGEMFDVLGTDATVTVEEYYAPYLEREYLEGGRWTAHPPARGFLPDGKPEASLDNPIILVADQEIESIDHVRTILELASQQTPKRPLLVVAKDVKGEALNALLLNFNRGILTIGAAVPADNIFPKSEELADIALLTGAGLMDNYTGRSLSSVKLTDLGQARRVVFNREQLTIIGGGGNPAAVRQRVGELRTQMKGLERSQNDWEKLRLRTARLAGGVGVLKVGAYTEREREYKKDLARKAVRMLDLAMTGGVVPGGGTAFLDCISAVQAVRSECADEDEARGVDVLAKALSAPFLHIAQNYGRVEPQVALFDVLQLGPGHGLDVHTGQYALMVESGILDCANVVRGALAAAVSAANMVITTNIIVQKR